MLKIHIYAITNVELLDEDVFISLCTGTPGIIKKLRGFMYENIEYWNNGHVKVLPSWEDKKDYTFNAFCSYDAIKEADVRGYFLADIYNMLEDERINLYEHDIEVKFYIMTADAQIYSIHDFNKMTDEKIKVLNSQVSENIMADYIKYQNQRDEIEKELKRDKIEKELKKDTEKVRKVQALILSQSLTKLMVKNIDDHKQEFEDIMVRDILTVREEEAGIIRTEFDIVEKFMKDNGLEEVKSCTYNGEAIELRDLVDKIQMHTLPAYLTQINIMDTLQDEFTIETEKGTIHRKQGGILELEK